MHVAVEATRFKSEVRGIGRYVRALLPRMATERRDLHFTLFVNPDQVAAVARGLDTELATRCAVASVRGMTRAAADLCWFPWNLVRPVPPAGPVVVTIHDIAPLTHPESRWTAWPVWARARRRFAITAARATLVVADSAFTASEVTRVLGVPPERLRIVPLGADDTPPPSGEDAGSVLARLGAQPPFFLAVGADEPRKNLALLDRAMARLNATEARASLVQVGPGTERARPAHAWRHALGFISDGDLEVLYRHAVALVMPSRYEGFGLPVLEAMRSGTAVVCARASSLPEVAGTAAAFVDPDDDAGLAVILARLLDDQPYREMLRRAGPARAAEFRWSNTARATLNAFDEAMRLG